ncbi:hypothetical protein GJ496_000890 [Pomphorhynchus laevis]|nr:hypothetical protein GJ496_000890 [Pomphorhynchus laevis]
MLVFFLLVGLSAEVPVSEKTTEGDISLTTERLKTKNIIFTQPASPIQMPPSIFMNGLTSSPILPVDESTLRLLILASNNQLMPHASTQPFFQHPIDQLPINTVIQRGSINPQILNSLQNQPNIHQLPISYICYNNLCTANTAFNIPQIIPRTEDSPLFSIPGLVR